MITFKFVIDITKSNSHNIPGVYLFLSKLFRWLEKEAPSSITDRKKNYVGVYFGDADQLFKQKHCSCSAVFEQGEHFLRDFAERPILNGSPDGREAVKEALELAVHVGRTALGDKKAKDIIFLFTDQTLEEKEEFRKAENRELLGVFLFADFSVNITKKDIMRMSFPIKSGSRSMEPAIQYDWEILRDIVKGLPDCIMFPVARLMEL